MIFTYLYSVIKKIVYTIITIGCDPTENILAFKRRLIYCKKNNSSDEFDILMTDKDESISEEDDDDDDELGELVKLDSIKPIKAIKPIHPPKSNIKSNTSPNLLINKESLQIKTKSSTHLNVVNKDDLPNYEVNWYCGFCKKKLLPYANIYCCNDNIFCTPNCRDRFLNYFRLNNNI